MRLMGWKSLSIVCLLSAFGCIASAGGEDGPPCGRVSDHARPDAAPRLEVGKKILFAPHRVYRTLRFAGRETLELFGPEPATAEVNRQLRQDLDRLRKRCEPSEPNAADTGDEIETEPVYWTSQWVTVKNYIWYAGTGTAGISRGHRTWDLQSGQQVDLWSWFGQAGGEQSDIYAAGRGTPSPKLMRFLFGYARSDPEWAAGADEPGLCSQQYDLTLEKSGMRFYRWQDYFGGCEVDILVPYNRLSPVLSVAGKSAVRRILKGGR